MTRTAETAAKPISRHDGINWDTLIYATLEEAEAAHAVIRAGTNSEHGRARVGAIEPCDEGFRFTSHYYNSAHPIGTSR